MQADEIAQMQLLSINSSFDAFTVDMSITELDFNLVDRFFQEIKSQNRIKLTDNNVVNLEKLGLTKKEIPTFASLLLFGNHNTGIHIGRFKDRDIIIDDILIKAPLVDGINDALRFIQKNISVNYQFGNQLKRIENWQYPIPVLREILLNAIIHRNYQSPNDITIKIFDNAIEFVSPGKLMGNLRVEDLMTDYYTAIHRNKLLCEAFYLLGEVEKYGTGFIRIRKQLLNYPDIKFEIDNSDGYFVKVTLSLISNEYKTIKDVGKDVGKELTQIQKEVYYQICQNNAIKIAEIAQKLGLTERTVQRIIAKLRKLNKIQRIGGRKNGVWKPI